MSRLKAKTKPSCFTQIRSVSSRYDISWSFLIDSKTLQITLVRVNGRDFKIMVSLPFFKMAMLPFSLSQVYFIKDYSNSSVYVFSV